MEEVEKAKQLIDSLEGGPATGGGYLGWPGDLLLEAEFNLARLAERIAEKEAQADAAYTKAEGKYKEMIARSRVEIRKRFSQTRDKFTKDEVEDEAVINCIQFREARDDLYEKYKTYKVTVSSIQRHLLALTHRINELQIERKYVQ